MVDLKIEKLSQDIKLAFADLFLEEYLKPAFGAKSKTEIDILVFTGLINSGALPAKTPIYEIARSLNITPSRARTLLLNWQLRSAGTELDLKKEIVDLLKKTRFAKDNNYLTFGIENPLLKEDIIARLKKKGIYADATFSREIVRLTVDAFIEFVKEFVDADNYKKIQDRLVKDKLREDLSFKGLTKAFLSKIGEKAAGKIGSSAVDVAIDGISDSLGNIEIAPFFAALFSGDTNKAVAIVRQVLKD